MRFSLATSIVSNCATKDILENGQNTHSGTSPARVAGLATEPRPDPLIQHWRVLTQDLKTSRGYCYTFGDERLYFEAPLPAGERCYLMEDKIVVGAPTRQAKLAHLPVS